jgi:hypothetical protein
LRALSNQRGKERQSVEKEQDCEKVLHKEVLQIAYI